MTAHESWAPVTVVDAAMQAAGPPECGDRCEVIAGPYAELCGVVTWTAAGSVWLRLDGDAVDLRFAIENVGPA